LAILLWSGRDLNPRLPRCELGGHTKLTNSVISGRYSQKTISVIAAIVNVISMTTISVTEDVKEKLLKVASELQIKLGRRVDLNDALRFLVDQREKNPRLLEEACSATTGVKEALKELVTERKLDDARLERKISHRHKRIN